MLSYRHGFHAGNFADVLKHTVLARVLEYMIQKEKGFSYIDTHAGAGMYQLTDDKALKTGEYKAGIGKLWQQTGAPESLFGYLEVIESLNPNSRLTVYPGSPAIASHYLRRQDAAFLFDLHPTDFKFLSNFVADKRKFQAHQNDGFKGLKGLLPPATQRTVVLIDPPYELKTDYQAAITAIENGYRAFNRGTFILWYPVVQRHYIDQMQAQFANSAVRNVLQIEWQLSPDNIDFGMTGTGLFIVNPPWTLKAEAEVFMPYLNQVIGQPNSHFEINTLIAE